MMNQIPKNTSLILEGGSYRTIFTSGVLDFFIKEGIKMPYILAISAGAVNAASYITMQKDRSLRVFINYRHDTRYIGMKNFFTEKCFVGLDFAYNKVPNELDVFDWDKYYHFDGLLKYGVTNANTGEIEFINAMEMDRECTLLRAACAIPVMFPEIEMNGVPYYDGGLADPIPIRHAIDEGFEKHVIVMTRPKGYRKKTDSQSQFAIRMLKKKYPKLAEVLSKRAEQYNETIEFCEQLEREGKAFIYRPATEMRSFEKKIETLHFNYSMGYEQAVHRAEKLQQFLSK